jgi:hypothetical protein
MAGPTIMELRVPVPLHQHEEHAGQSVGAQNMPLDNSMLRIVAAVQQLMTEFNGAVLEKMVAIIKTVKSPEAKRSIKFPGRSY